MPKGTTLVRLVDEFTASLYQHGIVIDRQAVEQEMQDRIAQIADRLQVDPQTVLREHACDGWGRQMSADVVDQIQSERLLEGQGVMTLGENR
ncbi:hypothetical protein BJ973_009124 [Actinoplanes tereljensis]|uniref:Uncharacterized protein n=1 Tax=Paractinoplanes tereljensis TaxID=571912 RepID=A0A919NH81_9ACTN|nr:hypothetical protein [Actinoplanes tereljensis]GIF17912.1 hypothetical protein Ate02nite_06420 [Actinoplanes tereljensis]